MLLRELEPEKYWSFPSTWEREKRTRELDSMIMSGKYWYQLKTDGNYSAFICDFDGDKRLITRGLSKVTGEYGIISDKVFFFDAIQNAFDKPTRIMAEVWLDGGIDRHVGSILRAAEVKAKSIQDDEYYRSISKTIKFSAKDKRDIENNEFRNQKLKWRIFDVWYYDGEDLTHTPWVERQKYVRMAAERINHELVTYVNAYPMTETFYDALADIFEQGGEGVVCYRADGLPEPGKRTAHKTLKVKREVENLIDCLITGVEPAIKGYTGKDITHWQFWEDIRTGEKLCGDYYGEWHLGRTIEPITKGYYYGWPGAIYTSVYDQNGELVPLCKVAGLTEELKQELRDNFSNYYLCPVTIGGMALSDANGLSVRHPYLKSIRKDDINPADCTLQKILN